MTEYDQNLIKEKLCLFSDDYLDGRPIDKINEWLLNSGVGTDSVMPGVCMNPDCDFTGGDEDFESACEDGWCPSCEQNTVMSILMLEASCLPEGKELL